MNITELNEKAKSIIGTDYDAYCSVSKLRDVFGKEVAACLPEGYSFSYEHDSRGNADFYIYRYVEGRIIKEIFARGRVTKTKVNSHHTWYGSYCDWAVKDAGLKFYDYSETLEEAVGNAVTKLESRVAGIVSAKQKNIMGVKSILDKTGLSYRELATLARYIKENEWSLEDELKKLGGTN